MTNEERNLVQKIADDVREVVSHYEYQFNNDCVSAREKYATSIEEVVKSYAKTLGFDPDPIAITITSVEPDGKTHFSISGSPEFIAYLNANMGSNENE